MSYRINKEKCILAGHCISACPVGAIEMKDGYPHINEDVCISCGSCAAVCPASAPEEV